jgi:LPXTG-motif cell wall-anchored protein
MEKNWSKKRIPTLLGLGVLIVGLVAGIIFLGQGFGAFSPRATAQTTPKNVEITNVTDTSFTVSFVTDEATAAFIKYGTTATALNSQVSDDRDQISGTVGTYTTHYISLRELQPNTTYFFTLGTGSSKFDNAGQPYSIKTANRGGNPGPALTIYGTVKGAQSEPASGAIVYAQIDGVTKLSSLVKDSGSWSIPLSNARTVDGTSYAKISSTSIVTLLVQGLVPTITTTGNGTVAEMQPATALTLGGSEVGSEVATQTTEEVASPSPVTEVAMADTGAAIQVPVDTTAASSSASADSATASPAASLEPVVKVVDLQSEAAQVVDTTQPVIMGQAPANVKITIEVHSTTQITSQVQADDTGSYSLDLAELSKNLEPGVHTVTISYTDPQTGKTVTQQKTFTVAATATSGSTTQQLALASASPTPFGSSNPYSIPDPSPTPTPVSTDSSDTRVTVPATVSGIPETGSTETSFALIGMGVLLLLIGGWSFIFSRQSLVNEGIDD